jgi:hypothetical protein
MLQYSTEFPINATSTVPDVIQQSCEWIKSSPHSQLLKKSEFIVPELGENHINNDHEKLSIAIAKSSQYSIGGIKYSRVEPTNLEWTTTCVAKCSTDNCIVNIQIQCDALESTIKLPDARKPILIRKIISTLGGGMDGEIPITDRPFRLDEGDEEIAALLINGVAGNILPIIYVSYSSKIQLTNPTTLAKLASGMAHVVLEPSASFSFNLKHLVSSKNVYNGAIGVYWPDNNTRYIYISTPSRDYDCIQSEILDKIRTTFINKRSSSDCSWLHLQEVIARNNYDRLKLAGETELSEWYELYKSEITTKNNLLEQSRAEISRLTAEIKAANAKMQEVPTVISYGCEQDYYESEVRDTVVDALIYGLQNTAKNSRRHHILKDIIDANPVQGLAKTLSDEIKRTFKTYATLDQRARTILTDLGFSISEDGKHYKLIYRNDTRYTFSVSKTPSDHRGGKNMASDINKILFR